MHSTRAVSLGETALEVFRRTGKIGKVLSVFDHTINILSSEEALVTIACKTVDDSPINLKVDSSCFKDKGRPTESTPVTVKNDSIFLGNSLLITGLRDAPIWRPDIILPQHLEAQRLLEAIHTAVNAVKIFGQPEGFKPLLPHIRGLISQEPNSPLIRGLNPYAEKAFPSVKGLVECLELRDVKGAAGEATQLIGLGPGLTPSGDDFLCGLLGTLSIVSPFLGDLSRNIDDLNRMVLSSVNGRTNPISREYLKHYAGGKPSMSISRMIQNLLDGSESSIEESIQYVCRVGHSSGTDIAVGVLTAFSILLRTIYRIKDA